MRKPQFLRLAQIDDQHFITACRHGLVHLTWGRATVRLSRDEFRRLAALLARALEGLPPTSVRDGEMRITCRREEVCEARLGPWVLLLSPAEFEQFAGLSDEAVGRLDKLLASGAWDEEEEEAAPDFSEQLRRNPFSLN
jgi:hypothetical protein